MPLPVLVALALAGFAANSLLCRQALLATAIEPAAFTAVRILSGALMLAVLFALRGESRSGGAARELREASRAMREGPRARRHPAGASHPQAAAVRAGGRAWRERLRGLRHAGDLRGALALFVYAIAFAQAYEALDAGVGALLLFGAVQLTMLAAARLRGERFGPRQWAGFALAALGLVAMKLPLGAAMALGDTARPVEALPWTATLSMLLAGVAWGLYSLLGRGVSAPLAHTAGNFIRATPLALLFAWFEPSPLIAEASLPLPWDGIACAAASGALASGVGYALWYAALPRLLASQAALLQLLVPVLAAIGGITLLHEPVTLRLLLGGAAILGGVFLAVQRGKRAA